MYRKYKGRFTKQGLRPFSAAAFLSDVQSLPSASRPASAMSLSNVDLWLDAEDSNVTRCWRIIEQQCWKYERLHRNKQKDSLPGQIGQEWKTVRIFVSSTFTDFHNEREILVKKVFPALREWCECRKLHLIECDLRWGIPKDISTTDTIVTCLEELDRCHQETDGEPFFINMLSERYGWIPSQEELPSYLKDCYDWVPGVSMTHMEILHGAYRVKSPNAVFFIREPSFLETLPMDKRKSFVDDDDVSQEHLKVLKHKLEQSFPPNQINYYDCHYVGVDMSTGREKVVFEGLDEFARKALDFFQEALTRKYPNRYNIESLSRTDQEDNAHLLMMETLTTNVEGLEEQLAALMKFAQDRELNGFKPITDSEGKVAPLTSQLRDTMEMQGIQDTDIAPLCIVGVTGSGKSALAASFAKMAMKDGLNVLYHCVGSTSDSRSDLKILGRIILALRDTNQPDKSALPDNMELLYGVLKERFEEWRETNKQLIIVIDGIDKVDDANQLWCMSWLPVRFPRNICCIVTVDSSHKPCMARLIDRQVLTVTLKPLDRPTVMRIVENFFKRYNKRLDAGQMQALVSKKPASHPLWLSLACEELRVFGDFRMLTKKIKSLPESLGRLLAEMLTRLLRVDKEGHLSKVLRMIYCSLDGIPESELLRLLSDSDDHEPVPLLSWSTVRRELKAFINCVTFGYNGVQRIMFKHEAIKWAVEQQLLRSEAEKIYWHQYLAEYYQYYCSDPSYTFEDLPYHMYKGGLWKQMIQYYRDDNRSIVCPPFYRQKYLNLIRCERHTPDIMNLSRPVRLCQMCAMKPGLASPLSTPAKSTCIVCGAWIVSHPSTETVGRVCIRHCGRFGPTSDQCFYCERLIHGTGAMSTPGLLCHSCSFGRNAQRCAKLLESDSVA